MSRLSRIFRTISLSVTGVLLVMLVLTLLAPVMAPHVGLARHRDSLPAPGTLVDISSTPGEVRALNVYAFGASSNKFNPEKQQTIILAHGVPGSGNMMMPLALALADQGFHTVTYDRLGWVHSTPRPTGELADPPHNANDLIALVEALNIERPILLGYSYGGGVVQEVNRIAPTLAACNVLLSSLGNGRPHRGQSTLGKIIFSEPVMRWTLSMTPTAKAGSEGTMRALYYPDTAIPEAEWMTMLATLDSSVSTWLREGNERWMAFEGFSPEAVIQPTLIIHGEQDAVVDVEVARQLADEIPHARAHYIAGMGHAAPLTHADQIARLITAFVTAPADTFGCTQAEDIDRGAI
ncbi:MAG: alpha/beta fold hydrolase [Pseudomonadota bacterium]